MSVINAKVVASPAEVPAVDHSTGNRFKDLVQKEFGRTYGSKISSTKFPYSITWDPRQANSCSVVDRRTDYCCYEFHWNKPRYTLTLKDGGRVQVKKEGGDHSHWTANSTAANVKKLVSRIENQLVNNTGNDSAMVTRIATATATATVAAAATPPQAEAMIREDAKPATQVPMIADEITKLKALLDDRTLTKKEFQKAKKIILASDDAKPATLFVKPIIETVGLGEGLLSIIDALGSA
jgi:hypothetical protein